MASGVNKVILIGNLGKDPEVRYLENGSVVANLAIATTETYKDKNGNRVDTTEWHDLEMWDGLAKIAEQYLKKGNTIYVEGKLKSDTWQDDQGNNRKKIRVRVQNMTMLGGPQAGNSPSESPQKQSSGHQNTPESSPLDLPTDDVTDDLPF